MSKGTTPVSPIQQVVKKNRTEPSRILLFLILSLLEAVVSHCLVGLRLVVCAAAGATIQANRMYPSAPPAAVT